MAFDIRAIFTRSLGGRDDQRVQAPEPAPEEMTDEEAPMSPISAAGSSFANPDVDDMSLGGATNATAFIPEGVDALPSASVDRTHAARDDDAIDDTQAMLVAEIALAAAVVDGHEPQDDEIADLLESLAEIPGLDGFTDDDLRDMVASLMERAESDDPEAIVAALEDRVDEIAGSLTDPTLRRAAYQLAVYFCAWDGDLTDAETDLLEAISEAFEVPLTEARHLREATLVEAGEEGHVHDAFI